MPKDSFLELAKSAMIYYSAEASQLCALYDGHDQFFANRLRERELLADVILDVIRDLENVEGIIANMTPPSN